MAFPNKQHKNTKMFFFWGVVFISLSFFLIMLGLFFSGYEKETVKKQLADTRDKALNMERELEAEQRNLPLESRGFDRLGRYFPDKVIVNVEDGEVLVTRGNLKSHKGRNGTIYEMYRHGEKLGSFVVDETFQDISFGHIVEQSRHFPENQDCFKAEFEEK